MEPVVSVTTHLGRPLTYLRLVFLLLGAALAVALLLLDATLVVVAAQYLSGIPLVAVAVVIAAIPIGVTVLVPPIREVEGVAAESLLGVEFPDGRPGPARRLEERLRATAWFVLHVVSGGAVVMGVIFVLPLGISWLTASEAWRLPAGLALLVAALVAPFVLGAAVARVAPVLLGPSYPQRLQQLETETARLVERNRIARELHDSVGHALSVVTLQSAGARRRLQARDPEAAEAALEAIETTARAATAELDHMLGLLRDRDGKTPGRPALGLGDLDSLVMATRRAGLEVGTQVDGDLADLPPVVSREAYRIVQEGLTNALRHASEPRARLRLERRPDRLLITLANPARASAARRRGSRGLTGLVERTRVLGGSVTHGSSDGTWELAVELPLPRSG
ncbi:MAG TPA: histidine kinase [Nocardioides sp.]|nr:histidine kinase [Nocardioides sp.]